MRITKCFNTNKEEIAEKQFNIFIGISLGNKYFTPQNIQAYIVWALENTKNKVAVLIPDKIHAINYEVKNDYSPERARSVAQRKGDKVKKIVLEIKNGLRIPESKLQIIRWEEIENESHLYMLKVFHNAFRENADFKEVIIKMVKETPHLSGLGFDDSQYAKLAQYVLDELPMLMSGIQKDNVSYQLLPYPGFANIDYLAIDLQEGKSFPEITNGLNIKNKLRLVEAFVE